MAYNNKSLKNIDQTTHGMSKTRFYRIYCHMWNRCNREKNDNYKNYGGKGIKLLRETFEEFKNDMYDLYKDLSTTIGEENVSIDRINNNGNYCKDNCRRIDIKDQQGNRDINNYITYEGKTMNLRQRAKELGIDENLLRSRIVTRKWDIDKAFNTPVGNNFGNPIPIKVIYNGKKYTVDELVKVVPYSKRTIYRKIKKGRLPTA